MWSRFGRRFTSSSAWQAAWRCRGAKNHTHLTARCGKNLTLKLYRQVSKASHLNTCLLNSPRMRRGLLNWPTSAGHHLDGYIPECAKRPRANRAAAEYSHPIGRCQGEALMTCTHCRHNSLHRVQWYHPTVSGRVGSAPRPALLDSDSSISSRTAYTGLTENNGTTAPGDQTTPTGIAT